MSYGGHPLKEEDLPDGLEWHDSKVQEIRHLRWYQEEKRKVRNLDFINFAILFGVVAMFLLSLVPALWLLTRWWKYWFGG